MSLVLQQTLRGLCHNTPWSYAVFWKLKERARIVLTWEDGFFDYAKRNQAPAGEGDEVDNELLGLAVAKMSYHVYSYGEGIIGKIAFSGKHQWVFMGASVNTDEKHPVGWENQFMAGIKTIAVIAVPQGVVQLGSTRVVQEDLALVNHVRSLFTTLRSIPGAFLSDLMAEGPAGAQFNLAAFQTPQWAPPTQPQTRPPYPSLSQGPIQEGPVPSPLGPHPSHSYARPPQTGPPPAQSPRGTPVGRPPYPPIAPRGPWMQPNVQMGGYYTQVTPQLVAEGSPYGVPHPYGVPTPAPVYSNPPTPSDGEGSQGGFSMGGGIKSQRKGQRMGVDTASSGGGQSMSEARSSDSAQPRMQRQLSSSRKDLSQLGGPELRSFEGEGVSLTPPGLPNQQLEFSRRLDPRGERATSSVMTEPVPMQTRPSTSYLRHSAGSLPDRYQTFLMAPQQRPAPQQSAPSGRLSLLAPNPIQVQQARVELPPQAMLDKAGYFRTHLHKGPGLEKEASPKEHTGCSTVSHVQPDVLRSPLDTQSEGASTAGESGLPPVRKRPETAHVQSNFSGGGSSSLSTQVSAPPPGLRNRLPGVANLRVSTGFNKMLNEGEKPTLESVEAYRMQQQAQLESLEKAGLKGTEVYNMWEEIMKENYRVGLALAGLTGGQDATDPAPIMVEASPDMPTSSLPAGAGTHQWEGPRLGRQRSGYYHETSRGGAAPAISETPLISSGATEQIQNMQLSSGSRSPDLLEVRSDRADQAEPQNPEGGSGRSSRASLRAGGIPRRGSLKGTETVLELAAMYSHSADVTLDSRGELGAEAVFRGGGGVGLSRMMPTPGLSPTPTELDLPASETPSPTVEPVPHPPAEAFKPRSSPPVPLFSERSMLAPLPNARTPSPGIPRAGGVPLFNNDMISSLPTSSVWAIALKGSGEAAARRRAGLGPSPEPAMSHQGSAATQPMSYSMQPCASSDVQTSVPSTPSAVRMTSAADAAPGSEAESLPSAEEMTVMSAGGVLESSWGAGGSLAGSPAARLEHAVSAPAGWDAPSAGDVSKRSESKRKSDFDDQPEASDAFTGEGAGESERVTGRGRKKGKLRTPAEGFVPHELTSTGRPKPKDRQQIQKRLAELRGLVPNTGKLPIDGLLERTIKHLEYLNCVKSEKPVKKAVQFLPLPPPAVFEAPKPAPETPVALAANPRKRHALRSSSSLQTPEVAPKMRPERPAFSEASALNSPSLKPPESTAEHPELGLNLMGNPAPDLPQLSNPQLFANPQQSFGEPLRREGALDPWARQPAPGGSARLGRPSSVEHLLSGLYQEQVVVEILKDPRHMLIEVLCKDESFYAELSGFLHGLGLQVQRAVLQTVANGQQWARFMVETAKPMDRSEVLVPLRRFIESKTGGFEGNLESRATEAGGSGNQLSLLPPLDMDFGAHFSTTHWQGLEGVLEHDLNMYLDDPY